MTKLESCKFEHKTEQLLLDLDEKKIPIRLALIRPNGFPLVISLWYFAKNEKIYCATKKDAKIVKYLKKNPKCSFEIASDNMPYRGIRGYGVCLINNENGTLVLDKLMNKYLNENQNKLKQYLTYDNNREIALEIIPYYVSNYDYTKRMTTN
jgi:nitroimidazol reductase NimA-like FMN-containing flavoprotein (pyridoxamine 5'-phosphate oxidase superfamily)